MLWYSHLFQNLPQFIVIHTVKGFGIVNKADIDVFLELSCFFDDPANVGNLISVSSAFSMCVCVCTHARVRVWIHITFSLSIYPLMDTWVVSTSWLL